MRWFETIDLKDIFADGVNPLEHRDEIARRINSSAWPNLTGHPGKLKFLVERLANEDDASANEYWHGLYDLADEDRVWINIH